MNSDLINALNNQTDYGVIVVRNYQFVYVTNNFSKLFGYERDELLNLNLSDLIISKNFLTYYKEIVNNKELINDSNKIIIGRKKDGSLLQLEVEKLEKIEYNNFIIIYGIIKPCREIKRESTLSDNEDIILIKNINGEVLESNNFSKKLSVLEREKNQIDNWYETDDIAWNIGIIKYRKAIKFSSNEYRNYKIIKIPFHVYEGNTKNLLVIGMKVDDSNIGSTANKQTFIELEDLNISIDLYTSITVLDKNFSYIYANENFCKSINYSMEYLVGKTIQDLNSGYYDSSYFDNIYNTVRTGKTWKGNIKSYQENNLIEADVTIIPILDSDGDPYKYITIRNDLNRNKDNIEVSNKLLIRNYIAEQIKLNQADKLLAVYVMEIEEINLLERLYGSDIINRYIEYLQINFKEAFIKLLSKNTIGIALKGIVNIEQVDQVAGDLSGLSKVRLALNEELVISAIVGVSFSQYSSEYKKEIMDNAFFALEVAKEKNKKYQIYNTELVDKVYKKFILKRDLFYALNNNELELYYQPKFNNQKRVIGAEALIRWNHPTLGLIPPLDFISMAEETELIIPIGEWVIRSACEQGIKWQKLGYKPIIISVNTSPIQLQQEDFIESVKTIIDETKYNSEYLELEITEEAIHDNIKIISTIRSLKRLGLTISIDDFGTGYSSYELLKNYDIDTLKIDRSFIFNISKNVRSKEIAASIINLAKQLKLNIVAEGVENDEQLNILKSLDCSVYQGYLISKPVPANLFEKFIDYKDLFVERRKFFRVNFPYPLEANLEILEINKKQVNMGKTFVLIENMSAGGICFVSNIKFPIEESLVLGFETTLLKENISVQGCIVWSKEDKDFYRYGLQLNIDNYTQDLLIRLLNKSQIKLKNSSLLEDSRIIKVTDSKKRLYFQ